MPVTSYDWWLILLLERRAEETRIARQSFALATDLADRLARSGAQTSTVIRAWDQGKYNDQTRVNAERQLATISQLFDEIWQQIAL